MQNTLFGAFDDLPRTKIEAAVASGAYDVGVEALVGDSLKVTDRRTLYVHPQSGAETEVFTIARRDRNRSAAAWRADRWQDECPGSPPSTVPALSLMRRDARPGWA
jgi:hypothetical protein